MLKRLLFILTIFVTYAVHAPTMGQCADIQFTGFTQFWKDVNAIPDLKNKQVKKIKQLHQNMVQNEDSVITTKTKNSVLELLNHQQTKYFNNFIKPKKYLKNREIEWNGTGRSENKGGC